MNYHTSFIIYHHHSMSQDELVLTISSYQKQHKISSGSNIEIIVMLDGVKLQELPIIEYVLLKNSQNIVVVEIEEKFIGPAKMWNKGFKISTGEYVVFTWSGACWYSDSLIHLAKTIEKQKVDLSYGIGLYEDIIGQDQVVIPHVGLKDLSLDILHFVNAIPLCYTVIRRGAVARLGGFCEDIEMTRVVDWEFLIRLTTRFKAGVLVGRLIKIKVPLASIGYQYPFKYTLDEQITKFITNTYRENAACKIAIITGINESAQVQLCILNYLECTQNKSLFTWRRFVENQISPDVLEDYDLVFFIRSRSLEALSAAKFCYEHQIKTIYILDDNWFWATQTYPQLETQIGKNTPYYYFFILLITTVDYLLVYNDLLVEDLKKYNHAIFKLPPNVNTSYFEVQKSIVPKKMINIGFAGSSSKLQHFGEAFKALERIMKEFKNVQLYFKGLSLPSTFDCFKDRIIQSQYTYNYKDYAKQVSSLNYDIMLSPLDDTRYTNSKCPNKYLEITALKAVGIYSNIALYRGIIKNGYNGMIINNVEEEWYQTLKLLITNEHLRNNIIKYATEEINKKYETQVVFPQFMSMLERVLGKQLGAKERRR